MLPYALCTTLVISNVSSLPPYPPILPSIDSFAPFSLLSIAYIITLVNPPLPFHYQLTLTCEKPSVMIQ